MENLKENKKIITVLSKNYYPWYKFGIIAMLKLIKGRNGTKKDPILLKIEDPQFGRLLRLLSSYNGNTDTIGKYDHHLIFKSKGIDTYVRVECLGGRFKRQEEYKGENEI